MNSYRLISGAHTRWQGDKATGSFVRHVTGTDTAIMSNLSSAEVRTLDKRIEAVTVKPTVAAKPTKPLRLDTDMDVPVPTTDSGTTAAAVDSDAAATTIADSDAHSYFAELDAADAIAVLKGVTDVAEVAALRVVEAKTKSRKSVLGAADKRLAELGPVD